MDLLLKAFILAVVLVVIAAGAIVLFQKSAANSLTSAQAVQLVVSDLKAKNPGANITVINVSNSTLESHSWRITLSATYNATKPCPTLEIEAFDYPATGLVPSLDNVYTANCQLAQDLADAPSYVISSPAIAITRSYLSNSNSIVDYVNTYGYNNTYVTAKFITSNATLAMSNVWLVKYTASDAPYSEYAVLGQSGSVVETYNVTN